jgi:hypothetical protein
VVGSGGWESMEAGGVGRVGDALYGKTCLVGVLFIQAGRMIDE